MLASTDLTGTWRLRWSDGQRGRGAYAERDEVEAFHYIDATVPGEVHLDALKAGWIADPYVGTNVLAARWVEEMIWTYRREFDAPADARADGAKAWLAFDGLDYAATIVLNGKEVGKHKNAYYPARYDVTGKLRDKKNVLVVHLDPGLFEVADKPTTGYCHDQAQMLHKRHWLRKPTGQFSWDWSQRLINCGIFKPCRLEWTADPVRVEQWTPLASLSADLKTGTVRGRLFVEGLSCEPVHATLSISVCSTDHGQKDGTNLLVSQQVQIKAGLQSLEASLNVQQPALWWPREQGPQTLYTAVATLEVNGKIIGEHTAMIGFRHVRVNQDPHPVSGNYFNIEINGRKIFCRGTNIVPADMITAKINREHYEKLISMAVEANLNFIRVWGGGLYESDDFYEMCNREGILVWQDFHFTCGKYPMHDEAFLADVKVEVTQNIRRLAPNPSLIIWCGNNEMELATWHWDAYQKGVTYPDYAFFHLVLPRILSEEDPTRFYHPSSPFSPDHQDPNRHDMGDQHPWTECLGLEGTDLRGYRKLISRFADEGGMLGPPSLPTLLACLPEGQQHVSSFAWQIHENSIDTWREPSALDIMLKQWIGTDLRAASLPDFVYWAGLVQGEALREFVDNLRRREFDSGGVVVWMFRDYWPMARSFTIVDYYFRRTPGFHPFRRAMAPISIVVVEQEGRIDIFGVNDHTTSVVGELRFGVFQLDGDYPLNRKLSVELPPNQSTVLASFDAGEWKDRKETMAFAALSRDGKLIARNRLSDQYFIDMNWPDPTIAVTVSGGIAKFVSDRFAWNVCIDLDGEALADNFFDLYPGVPYEMKWAGSTPPTVLYLGNKLPPRVPIKTS